jgi:hypothetical protein
MNFSGDQPHGNEVLIQRFSRLPASTIVVDVTRVKQPTEKLTGAES